MKASEGSEWKGPCVERRAESLSFFHVIFRQADTPRIFSFIGGLKKKEEGTVYDYVCVKVLKNALGWFTMQSELCSMSDNPIRHPYGQHDNADFACPISGASHL